MYTFLRRFYVRNSNERNRIITHFMNLQTYQIILATAYDQNCTIYNQQIRFATNYENFLG